MSVIGLLKVACFVRVLSILTDLRNLGLIEISKKHEQICLENSQPGVESLFIPGYN